MSQKIHQLYLLTKYTKCGQCGVAVNSSYTGLQDAQWLKVMVKGLKDDGTSEDASKFFKNTSISFTYK